MENNKNKKSMKFQGYMLNFCDFIQVFVFTRNHHLNIHLLYGYLSFFEESNLIESFSVAQNSQEEIMSQTD